MNELRTPAGFGAHVAHPLPLCRQVLVAGGKQHKDSSNALRNTSGYITESESYESTHTLAKSLKLFHNVVQKKKGKQI